MFLIFSQGGGFIVDPIYLNIGEQNTLMLLPFDNLKKGVNIKQVCLTKK